MVDRVPSVFEQRLAEAARRVEDRLELHLQRLATGPGSVPARLQAAMRHAVLAGGKRFRPFLVIEMARLLGGETAVAESLDAAAALECIHAYSLVHDDLPAMDNDELRRGLPTVWKAYDEWTAILAGDALLTLAFEILSDEASSLPTSTAIALVRDLARASGAAGMVGGQVLDLEAEKRGEPATPDISHVRRLQGMKTGALITFACMAGARCAGGDDHALAMARRYGDALGFAFQISDDLLDATGEAEAVGKAVGKDADQGKATLVGLYGVDAARDHLAAAVDEACTALAACGDNAGVLSDAARFMIARDR